MLFHYVSLSYLLTCVITYQAYGREFRGDLYDVLPSWPSVHHVMKGALEKRQAELAPLNPGQSDTTPLHIVDKGEVKSSEVAKKGVLEQMSEGNVEIKPAPTVKPPDEVPSNSNKDASKPIPTLSTVSGSTSQNASVIPPSTVPPSNTTRESNSVMPKAPSYQPDLSNPGVMKRGLIVFGAFALMAIAYFIFYRRKSKNNDSNNSHGNSDANQFRYGVLQSDDRRDNLELSRIPLTMESDEDEDEDLEIFDLEQKKKSLSYVNLQASDECIVHEARDSGRDKDSLLLDIEDANSDTLINWSSNGNKSIL